MAASSAASYARISCSYHAGAIDPAGSARAATRSDDWDAHAAIAAQITANTITKTGRFIRAVYPDTVRTGRTT
jgi:hypothetical protein